MPSITSEGFREGREAMLSVCTRCHSEDFSSGALSTADSVKNETDALVGEARDMIISLYEDGLLDPMPDERDPNPVTGHNLTLMGHQLYSNTSGIETLFFEMYKYHAVTAWKGAYHMSPDHTHWYGWAEVNHDLELIKAEDRELRARQNLTQLIGAEGGPSLTPLWAVGGAALAIGLVALAVAVMGGWTRGPGHPPKAR